MSLRLKYARILSRLVPGGAVGMSLLLGAAAPGLADQPPAAAQPTAVDSARVSDRLAAIRDAVSDMAGTRLDPERAQPQLTWWNWRNGGWRNGGWRNGGWRNWWRNW